MKEKSRHSGPQCPLLAISRHPDGHAETSALPPKADIRIAIPYQPLTNVCFAPNSGRSTGYRRISAFDPKRTLARTGQRPTKLTFASAHPKPALPSAPRRVCRCSVLQCPLMAISRHTDGHAGTSALPPKADINGYGAGCPLMTQSGH